MRWRPSERTRKYLREVGSIVLGVLIALGIGEIAEAVRWQFRAAETTRAINAELSRNAGVLEERLLLQPCIDRRVNQLAAVVKAARGSGRLPAIGPLGRTPIRPNEYAAWDLAVGSGTMLHLADGYRAGLAMAYPQVRDFPANISAEQQLWATLRVIEDSPGPVSADTLIDFATNVESLRYRAKLNALAAQQVLGFTTAMKIPPSYAVVLGPGATREALVANVTARDICKPLVVDGKPVSA